MKNRRRSPNHRVQGPVHSKDVAMGGDRAKKLYPDMVRGYWRVGAVGLYSTSVTTWWRETKRLWNDFSHFQEVRRLVARHHPSPDELVASPEAERDGV